MIWKWNQIYDFMLSQGLNYKEVNSCKLNSNYRLSVIVYDGVVVWNKERKICRASSVHRAFSPAAHNPLCVLSEADEEESLWETLYQEVQSASTFLSEVAHLLWCDQATWEDYNPVKPAWQQLVWTTECVCTVSPDLLLVASFVWGHSWEKWNRHKGNKERYISLFHKACMTGPT